MNPAATAQLTAGLEKVVDAWLRERADRALLAALKSNEGQLDALRRVIACSTYLAEVLARRPEALSELLVADRLRRPLVAGELDEIFSEAVAGTDGEQECMSKLRFLRHRELLRIVWRDLNALAEVQETLADLSALADAAIRAALSWARAELAENCGTPRHEDGSEASFVVLAMGKLGGRELNFSSDVDLVFLYSGTGETDGRRRTSNEQYFRMLAQRIINLLSKQTPDGFVYRVDTRLRPFGDSGPLAVSLPAFDAYLQSHGRDWERYAYIKARVVNDWTGTGEFEDEVLRPFVYRRYIDFGVFASLREMKGLIEAEGRRREYRENLKLGPGGIREIEFIVQSLQLARGGSVEELRDRRLQRVLPKLVKHRCLPAEVADELLAAYRFLRRAENCLQAIADRQTHDLPADSLDRQRLACAMRAGDWDAFLVAYNLQRDTVARHFRNILFRGERQSEGPREMPALAAAWTGATDDAAVDALLENAGFPDGSETHRQIRAFRDSRGYRLVGKTGKQRLDALMPELLRVAGQQRKPDQALAGAIRVIEAIGGRSAYFALLNENPLALQRLAEVCTLGEFLVRRLAAHPLLLDELLDPRAFTEPPGRDELAADLQSRLDAAGDEDDEQRYFALVNFQQANTFRVAVADLSGALPLMRVSDCLTDIAELVLQAALDIAWQELVSRHGAPRCEVDGNTRPASFAIIAYGKLGGLELGYGSDLDLVFLHDSTGEREETEGGKPLENAVFFARLTRRIINVLTLSTNSGQLYEVDTRLRPSGGSGMLVSSITAFDRYQREDAWTWEHQALLRSRAVAGSATVCAAFGGLRKRALTHYVKRERLGEEVRKMRQRMRDELSRGNADQFDLKQDEGGVADIEFIVQYLVLKHAHRHPDLVEFSDNIRQLEALARNRLLPADDAGALADSYRSYRARLHRQSLAGEPGLVSRAEIARDASQVIAIWKRVLG